MTWYSLATTSSTSTTQPRRRATLWLMTSIHHEFNVLSHGGRARPWGDCLAARFMERVSGERQSAPATRLLSTSPDYSPLDRLLSTTLDYSPLHTTSSSSHSDQRSSLGTLNVVVALVTVATIRPNSTLFALMTICRITRCATISPQHIESLQRIRIWTCQDVVYSLL